MTTPAGQLREVIESNPGLPLVFETKDGDCYVLEPEVINGTFIRGGRVWVGIMEDES